MASRLTMEAPSRPEQGRPEPGQILIVIHDFSARSSDELSLSKGDRVELIERDDDFGDGWYLGRHLSNGSSGLFPEVYTRIAPRGAPSYPPISSSVPRSYPTPSVEVEQEPPKPPTMAFIEASPTIESQMSLPAPDVDKTRQIIQHTSASDVLDSSKAATPLNTGITSKENEKSMNPPTISTLLPTIPAISNMTSAAKAHAHGQESPVMNETLSVIDEHITDMNSPHHSVITDRRGTNDSGSEYSSHLDHRMSYINGEETDEEEDSVHTREEVMTWNPDQVAEYLFTSGVESKHCEVFRDQEITGDVLLGMDQTSVFLKEFDLGSVGRRLKTWQKIKALQDIVSSESPSRRNTATYGSEIGTDDANRNRSRSESMMSSTMSSSMLPRIPSVLDRPGSRNTRLSQQHLARNDTVRASPTSPKTVQESARPAGEKRPSAASVRDMHHSRQNSANDFSTLSLMGAVAGDVTSPQLSLPEGHKKQPSFDKNWTMGGASTPPMSTPLPNRPLSSSGLQGIVRSSTDHLSKSTTPSSTFDALDRGYFSGGEVEGRQRNVLRKRTTSQGTHSRNSSYTDEQRIRTGTAHTRHSRFGSVDSIRASTPPSAAQKYYGLSVNGRRRTPSESSVNTPPRPAPPPKDFPSPTILSPTVTKLDGSSYEKVASPGATSQQSDWLLPVKPVSNRNFGLRAISDAVTNHEKSKLTSPTDPPLPSPVKESLESPSSRTGSSTPSGGPSFDLPTPDLKNSTGMLSMQSVRQTRKKSKKETSAYTRGLEKKTPQEQMVGADYSGWMKKKSTNLMTTWKSRLFILKGRRLSYYYSENDIQERGLIDISFHRVLPADNDRLTGLHATLTGVTNSPTSPNGPHTETLASKQAAAEPESTLSRSPGDSVFIFKLVPPRAGLSKAVSFTKPTVHYFAVPNIKQGRLWMAALMKATIDRDDTTPIVSTYQQKTISLARARQLKHRPPALMNLDEDVKEEAMKTPASDKNGLNIQGIIFDPENHEGDSGVSGVSKIEATKAESAGLSNGNSTATLGEVESNLEPKTA